MTADKGFGSRLRFVRERWHLTQDEVAKKSGVATIRRMEGAKYDPRLSTAAKLGDALQVRVECLLTGDEPMLSLADMTVEEQHRALSGPGTEGLPGYVIVGPGPWFTDDDGEWRGGPSPVTANSG
jgi:DNA-binding XRE family transcriptional regulator